MDPAYIFRIVLKKKWLILGAALLAAGTAFYFTSDSEKKYKSIAQISTGFTISDDIRLSNETFNIYDAETKFNNAIATLTSPAVISLISYSLILHDLQDPAPFRKLTDEQTKTSLYQSLDLVKARNTFQNKLELMTLLSPESPEEKKLLELLKLYKYDYTTISNNLNIYRLQRSDYIQVEYISPNPNLSAFIVNSDFRQFLRYYKSVRGNISQESVDTLRSLLEKKKQVMDEKNTQLRGQGIVDPGPENTSRLDLIMKLETTLNEEKNKLTGLNYNLERVKQKLAALGDAPVGKHAPAKNDELLILRQNMNDAYSAYVNSGSTDQALLKKYNTLKAQYETKVMVYDENKPAATIDAKNPEKERETLIDKKADIELEIKASTENIASTQNKIDEIKGNIVHNASKSAIVESLLKEAQLANKEYIDAKQKYNDATDVTESSVTNFREALPAQPALEPEPSKRLLIVGVSGISVLVIALLAISLAAHFDSSVKTPAIFSKKVNLRLISMVNFINLRKDNLAEILSTRAPHPDRNDLRVNNVFRESLRKLRYEIETSGKKIFLFTSTVKGEGKTTLIQALSYSLSLSKKKILIIDTNFCNNDLTVQLAAEPILEKINPSTKNGLSVVEQVKKASTNVAGGAVHIIGSEGGDYTPSEILPQENILLHLQELTGEYDYIFLEGPPLNVYSDSRELAKYVEGVIAVFSANHVIKQIDKESISFFTELDGKFSGAILNKIDPENVNSVV